MKQAHDISLGYHSLKGPRPKRSVNYNGTKWSLPVFIIPMSAQTGQLITEWHLGGMTSHSRLNFGLSKDAWNRNVVRTLELHVPKMFSGTAVFHLNQGTIVGVEIVKK